MKAQLSRIWRDWSESKLNLLFRCPLAFKLNYLERVAVPQSVEKVFGATIHYFLKRFFALKYGYKSPESFSRSFVGFWKGVLEGRHGPGGYNTPPVPLRFRRQKIDYFGLGIALLKQFYQENQSFLQGPNERPRCCETRLVFPFSGFRLTAILDRIQPEGGGETIYDYKTSVFQKSEIERAIDTQFTFYSLAYLKKFGQPPQRLALWYLRPQGSEIIAVPPRHTTKNYPINYKKPVVLCKPLCYLNKPVVFLLKRPSVIFVFLKCLILFFSVATEHTVVFVTLTKFALIILFMKTLAIEKFSANFKTFLWNQKLLSLSCLTSFSKQFPYSLLKKREFFIMLEENFQAAATEENDYS